VADIFVSYCSADRNVARKFVDALTGEGISVWWDDRLTPVEQWDRLLEKEIHAASAVLVIWTPRAVESDWVRIEANFGREKKKLLQARFEECDVPLQFTLLQWLDLDSWLASGDSPNWQKLMMWFRALIEVRTPVIQRCPIPAPSAVTGPSEADDFAQALADISLAAARSGSGRFDDVVLPGLGEKWPAFTADCRLSFSGIGKALTLTPSRRAKLFQAGLHLSLYFMRISDESQSFSALGMAMQAMRAADANELVDFFPSLRSVARIAIEELDSDDVAHYALGRMLGATAQHMCAVAPEPVRREWLAATSITLSAYGERAKHLTSGFREMSGSAGYSVDIVRFELPDVGTSFASALLKDTGDEGFADRALNRFSALRDASGGGPQ
jgi:hypothetical protein